MQIYGTIGPACMEIDILAEMFELGMTGIRLNVSHSSLEDAKEWVENIHTAAKQKGIIPQILIDLQGPELRIGNFEKKKIYKLEENGYIFLGVYQKEDTIPVPETVIFAIEAGQEILLDDGKVLLKAVDKAEGQVLCKVLRGKEVLPKKSIALQDKQIDTPTLTRADLENIQMAKSFGVTGVMLPFVRGKKDLENLRQALKENGAEDICIYAKIENMAGVCALDEIILEADEIVIARGDLGNAMPLWELPAIQKKIAKRCKASNRKFMVVTQMLASMEHAKVPTRAEVSDIFNAILDGADSVMLTGETAAGEYPVEAMRFFVKTVEEAQKFLNCIE